MCIIYFGTLDNSWDSCVHLSSCGSLCLCMKKQFSHQIDHSKASDVVMGSLCAFVFFRQALFVHEKTILSSD